MDDFPLEYDYSKPFRVRVIGDCSEKYRGKLTGKYGTLLGELDTGIPEIGKNPLIETDDGERIWGYECFWCPEEIAKNPDSELSEFMETMKKVCLEMFLE